MLAGDAWQNDPEGFFKTCIQVLSLLHEDSRVDPGLQIFKMFYSFIINMYLLSTSSVPSNFLCFGSIVRHKTKFYLWGSSQVTLKLVPVKKTIGQTLYFYRLGPEWCYDGSRSLTEEGLEIESPNSYSSIF